MHPRKHTVHAMLTQFKPCCRHLIFFTNTQAEILTKARTWYIDGTFRVVSLPFTQLLTVNAFITKGAASKQVPLAICLMSGRSTDDYKEVFRTIKQLLPSPPQVTDLMMDFEFAVWVALKEVSAHDSYNTTR